MKQRQRVDAAQAQFDDFTKQYLAQAQKEPPPAPLSRRLMIGLAQGMIYAGAAGAGQQVPHLDWIGDEVKKQVQQQQNVLNAYGHVAGLKLNSLQALQQRMDPISATHALTAGIYTQLGHEADAMAQKYKQGSAYDSAVAMRDAFNKKAADEQAAASQAHWQQVIQTIPQQTVGARAGGLPGMLAAIAQSMKGAPKETIEAAQNHLIEQIQKGEAPTFPGGPPAKRDRGQTAYEKEVNGRRIQLSSDFGNGVVFAPTDKEGEEARTAQSSYSNIKAMLTNALKIAESVPDRLSPTERRILKLTVMGAQNAYRTGMNMGVYKESEAPLLETETGADALLDYATAADRAAVIKGVLANLHHQTAAHMRLDQTTKTPEIGSQFYQQAGQLNARTPE